MVPEPNQTPDYIPEGFGVADEVLKHGLKYKDSCN